MCVNESVGKDYFGQCSYKCNGFGGCNCTYSGSGNYTINLQDYCIFNASINISRNNYFIFNGTGGVSFVNNIVFTGKKILYTLTGSAYLWIKNSLWFNITG